MTTFRATVLCVLGALLALAPGASAKVKTYNYDVELTFHQTRTWNYYYQTTTEPGLPPCTRTTDGAGLDSVKVDGTALLYATRGGVAGFGLRGRHTRSGAQTENVAGECAPSAVFPSTWSTYTETDGSVTATAPTNGCGARKPKTNFPTLTLAGRHLILEWDSDPTPDFTDCPYFDGANECSPGNCLPGHYYRDVVLKLPRGALKAGKKRVVADGTSKKGATETCANLTEPCPSGVSYNATALVDADAKAVLTRTKP